MRRVIAYLILLLIISSVIVAIVLPLLGFRSFAITGYDGPVATFNDITSPTITATDIEDGTWKKTVTDTHAEIYPVSADIADLLTPCGLRAEVQSVPNVISQDPIDTVSKSVIDPEEGTNTTTTVKIYKAKCTMAVVITTYSGGLNVIKDVTFWIALNDNADSIFSSAADRYAYFVEVYTREIPTQEGSMTVIPTSTGFTFTTTGLESEPVPQWLIDAGYTSSGSKFTSVKFPIIIKTAVPITKVDIKGLHRYESYTTFYLGFDVILTGKWVHVSDYKEFDWPELPDFWGTLFDMLMQFLWYFVGFTCTIVTIWKVKDPRYIVALLVCIWGLVLWQTGTLRDLIGVFGV